MPAAKIGGRSATNPGENMEALRFQRLLHFDPNGAKEEVYEPKSFRALLSKHLHDHAKKVKPSRRNLAAGEARGASDPCAGQAIKVARTETAGGRASP